MHDDFIYTTSDNEALAPRSAGNLLEDVIHVEFASWGVPLTNSQHRVVPLNDHAEQIGRIVVWLHPAPHMREDLDVIP